MDQIFSKRPEEPFFVWFFLDTPFPDPGNTPLPVSLQLSVARHSVQASQSQARDGKPDEADEDVFDEGRLLFLLLPLNRTVGRKALEVKDRRDRSGRRPSLDQATGSG